MIKRPIYLVFFAALAFASCSGNKPHQDSSTPEQRSAKGDRVYGGTFRFGMTDTYQTLFPAKITDVASAHIASQIYEGLVKFDTRDLAIVPAIAEKWEIDAEGTTYTFHLRKDVKFQDDACFPSGKGRSLNANDVLFSFEQLCTSSPDNVNFDAVLKDRVIGANEYYEASKKGKPAISIEGLKIIDPYTISIHLITPTSSFLSSLITPGAYIIAKEAFEKYGVNMKVGSGAFQVTDDSKPAERIILSRNPNYYGKDTLGNSLPFLDTLSISFFSTKQLELDQFQNGPLSFIWGLPAESIKDMVENQISDFNKMPPKYILDRSPEMSTQYYTFNSSKAPFNNLKVRQAFSYAINRGAIVENVLRGEAYGPGIYGITPPSFKGYKVDSCYEFNPLKAKKLLAEAGYPEGKDFPTVKLKLNSGGSRNTNVAIEIQKQLQSVLGIYLDFSNVPFKQKLEDEKHGNGDLFRSAWIADYPSPENFLWLFYGKTVPENPADESFPNTSRYKNKEFDKFFEAGRTSKSQDEAYKNFMAAEKLMMKDAPVIVLWYDENWRLTKSNVHNLHCNPMTYYDFSQVYLKDPEVGTQKAKKQKPEAGK
jgi:peptide/nickel transport system substrate-binding protein